jgi:hypothetical protein
MASYRYDTQGRRVEYIDETRSVTVRYAYDGANTQDLVAELMP